MAFTLIFQLLLGIKDTDDNLVAATLICLSELVPILGADTVIGVKRSKLFTDGRPNSKKKSQITHKTPEKAYIPEKSLRDLPCSEDIYESNDSEVVNFGDSISLNTRPSPVGGESLEDEIRIKETNIKHEEVVKINKTNNDSEEDWSDWENTNNHQLILLTTPDTNLHSRDDQFPNKITDTTANNDSFSTKNTSTERKTLLQKAAIEAKKNIVDISELDIKNQKMDSSRKAADEFDFFADMMPVIEKPTVVNIDQVTHDISSKLNFIPDDAEDNEGWGENWND